MVSNRKTGVRVMIRMVAMTTPVVNMMTYVCWGNFI